LAQSSIVKIYTKTGDTGQTGLCDGARVSKSHPRVAAYGDVDELNCALGAAIAALPDSKNLSSLRETLGRVQGELFVIGAHLAGFNEPLPPRAASSLEKEIDEWTAQLPPLNKFILPTGAPAAAALHFSRAVCRRAERAAVALSAAETVSPEVLVYLNRLSDHLFTAARWVNAKQKRSETVWEGLARKK
jgi:cob(I)alamin adenosyltransferase